MLDDATRRTLRFSLFLQSFAALMMLGALVVRVSAIGWDVVTIVLLAGVALIGAALVFTVSRLRAG
jgi:hypothetical protein